MANLNLNKVILAGRLTADPELKTTPSGTSATTFSIAVNRPKAKDQTETKVDFISCVAWRATAELLCKFFKKGSNLCVEGAIQTRTAEKDGQKRYYTEVLVSNVHFVESKSEGQVSAENAAPSYNAYNQVSDAPNFENLSNDEDLPF